MNLKELKELIELVSEKEFAEFEIERQGFRLRISRLSYNPAAEVNPPAATPITPAITSPPQSGVVATPAARQEPSQSSAGATAQAAQLAAVESASQESPLYMLKSPIVGTFYRSPNPEAPPFVEVGDRVKKGQVLCIIEAMKLMNEIESDVDGVIMEIYPQDAQPVEYGEPLFGIKV